MKNDRSKTIIKRVQGLFFLALVLLLSGCGKIGNTDTWVVEVHITEKETITREDKENGSEEVFLLKCEDADGNEQIFELTDTALEGKFAAAEAFKEIKTGKYYKFRVGWRGPGIADKDGYHPSVYGAVKMEGFNLEYLPNNIDEGDQNAGQTETALQTEEDGPQESAPRTERTEPQESDPQTGSAEPQESAPQTGSTEPQESGTQKESAPQTGSTEPQESAPQTDSIGPRENARERESIRPREDARPQESAPQAADAQMEESIAAERESLEAEIRKLEQELLELKEMREE